jgi:tetratricopeptide (TPR) repeat protein
VFVEAIYADSLDQYVDLLAYHYDHSQNLAKRCEYLQKAGEAARRAYANDAAIDYYRRLLPLFVGQDQETTHLRQSINTTLGELLVITGQYDGALEHLHTALALSAATADPDAKASACRWIARVYENRSEYGLALDWIQQGLEALGELDTPVKAEMLAIAGLIYTRQGQYTQALDRSRQSMDIAEQLGQTRARAFATNLLGHITRRQGQSAPAISFFEQALALYQQAEDIHGQALAHNNIANAYLYLGKFKHADWHYREARNIFDQAGDVYNRAFVDNNLGEIARKQGRLDEALHFYEAGLATLEIIGGSFYVMGVFHMNLGAILVQRGQIGQARQRLQMSQNYFAQAKARDFLPELHRHIAAAAFVAGELDVAEQQGLHALSLARELSMRGEEGASMRLLGEVATDTGQYDRAQQYSNESATIHREVKDEYEEAIAQFALARLYATRGQVEHARTVLEQCIGIFERIGAELDLAYAQSFQSKLMQAARAMQ